MLWTNGNKYFSRVYQRCCRFQTALRNIRCALIRIPNLVTDVSQRDFSLDRRISGSHKYLSQTHETDVVTGSRHRPSCTPLSSHVATPSFYTYKCITYTINFTAAVCFKFVKSNKSATSFPKGSNTMDMISHTWMGYITKFVAWRILSLNLSKSK